MWWIDRITQNGHNFVYGVLRIRDLNEDYSRRQNSKKYFTRWRAREQREAEEREFQLRILEHEARCCEAEVFKVSRNGDGPKGV